MASRRRSELLMTCAIITGASSGLGAAIYNGLLAHYDQTIGWDLKTGVDVTDEESIFKAMEHWPIGMRVHTLVNCAGVNKLAWLADDNWFTTWYDCLNTNALGIALVTKQLLHRLNGGTICNIISNAAHKPMRASLAYNTSKAAAYMMTKQMAHELWDDYRITVFGVSPNRLRGTAMSNSVDEQVAKVRGWSTLGVREMQMQAMPCGEETPPEVVAEFICWLLAEKKRHKYLHGAVLNYGA